ncbi:hypothetical protein ACIOEZ_34390 [Streptomyces sp. NPDC087866]
MEIATAHMVELIEGLKKAGLSEPSAIRFAAIVFAEQWADESDSDD